jgi:hypothetical protein
VSSARCAAARSTIAWAGVGVAVDSDPGTAQQLRAGARVGVGAGGTDRLQGDVGELGTPGEPGGVVGWGTGGFTRGGVASPATVRRRCEPVRVGWLSVIMRWELSRGIRHFLRQPPDQRPVGEVVMMMNVAPRLARWVPLS